LSGSSWWAKLRFLHHIFGLGRIGGMFTGEVVTARASPDDPKIAVVNLTSVHMCTV